ncbi:hypothetical protein AB6A40_007548 [Gnathostoma spinigerum]|uniref:Uncharacterized protein n=1 Tax=Gnathostoma spinigerum TaxID=75299 RepID=A0ABD6EU79_9BILA
MSLFQVTFTKRGRSLWISHEKFDSGCIKLTDEIRTKCEKATTVFCHSSGQFSTLTNPSTGFCRQYFLTVWSSLPFYDKHKDLANFLFNADIRICDYEFRFIRSTYFENDESKQITFSSFYSDDIDWCKLHTGVDKQYCKTPRNAGISIEFLDPFLYRVQLFKCGNTLCDASDKPLEGCLFSTILQERVSSCLCNATSNEKSCETRPPYQGNCFQQFSLISCE